MHYIRQKCIGRFFSLTHLVTLSTTHCLQAHPVKFATTRWHRFVVAMHTHVILSPTKILRQILVFSSAFLLFAEFSILNVLGFGLINCFNYVSHEKLYLFVRSGVPDRPSRLGLNTSGLGSYNKECRTRYAVRDRFRSKYIKEGSTVSKVSFHFSKGRKKSWRELWRHHYDVIRALSEQHKKYI
jgi:hypothetical protein